MWCNHHHTSKLPTICMKTHYIVHNYAAHIQLFIDFEQSQFQLRHFATCILHTNTEVVEHLPHLYIYIPFPGTKKKSDTTFGQSLLFLLYIPYPGHSLWRWRIGVRYTAAESKRLQLSVAIDHMGEINMARLILI